MLSLLLSLALAEPFRLQGGGFSVGVGSAYSLSSSFGGFSYPYVTPAGGGEVQFGWSHSRAWLGLESAPLMRWIVNVDQDGDSISIGLGSWLLTHSGGWLFGDPKLQAGPMYSVGLWQVTALGGRVLWRPGRVGMEGRVEALLGENLALSAMLMARIEIGKMEDGFPIP